MRQATLLIIAMASAGCSTMHPAQIGQAAGSMIGMAVAPGVGAPLGGLLGTLAGLVVQGRIDKDTEKKERVVLAQDMSSQPSGRMSAAGEASSTPGAGSQRVWVDEHTENGKIVAGQFEQRYVP
jgi:hypothetical protein